MTVRDHESRDGRACWYKFAPVPAPRKKPSPPVRMTQLLTIEKRRLLAAHGRVTHSDFRAAWDRSWTQMIDERAWAHATVHRRNWRMAVTAAKREFRAAFLDQPTPFSFAAGRLREAAGGMCLHLEPEQVGRALLAAIAYVEVEDEAAAGRASDAASTFVEHAAA